MAGSFEFTWEHKFRGTGKSRNPLGEMPKVSFWAITPEMFGSMDTPDAYDMAFGDLFISGLNEQQALMLLKKRRSEYMSEVNKIQKEIDRLTLLDMAVDDPRANIPWPRYYELRAKKK